MLPIAFTVAPVEPASRRVTGYLERDTLRNVQLPQKFSKAALVAAHDYAQRENVVFTEDATLCAVAGSEVFFIDGADRNFKVTTKTDVRLAGYLLGNEADDV
jgi:2-C-methyl-D-erythritol 4-phosphate cytidylyltransferase